MGSGNQWHERMFDVTGALVVVREEHAKVVGKWKGKATSLAKLERFASSDFSHYHGCRPISSAKNSHYTSNS